MTGQPIDCLPAFREPGARVELLDELGVQRALMFPTIANLVEYTVADDPDLTHAAIHAINHWLHDQWTFDYETRIFATPVITLPILEEAITELEWVLERGAKIILVRPAPANGLRGPRSIALPEFDPFWARVQEAGIPGRDARIVPAAHHLLRDVGTREQRQRVQAQPAQGAAAATPRDRGRHRRHDL